MEVNGAVPASAGTVTFTGIGSIALLGSFLSSEYVIDCDHYHDKY
jgi:hypothetical protein